MPKMPKINESYLFLNSTIRDPRSAIERSEIPNPKSDLDRFPHLFHGLSGGL
jgi:hypothetical protein